MKCVWYEDGQCLISMEKCTERQDCPNKSENKGITDEDETESKGDMR